MIGILPRILNAQARAHGRDDSETFVHNARSNVRSSECTMCRKVREVVDQGRMGRSHRDEVDFNPFPGASDAGSAGETAFFGRYTY